MNLLEECKKAGRIGISGHIRPDGDCIGSCMGLYLYLKKELPQAEVQVFLEKPADIYGCISRIEDVDSAYGEQKINIDHHISNANGCGNVNFVDPQASSTSELVYRLIGKDGLDQEIAEALYMGIVHDTGCFQYSCTSPDTLRAAADLISFGFDFSRLIEETFFEKTYLQTQILGRALLESIRFMDGRCVVSALSRKTLDFYGAGPQDLEGASIVSAGSYMLIATIITTPFVGIILVYTTVSQSIGNAWGAFVMAITRQGIIYLIVLEILKSTLGYHGIVWSQAASDILT